MTGELHIGDNLPVLRELESKSADLVYLDPPFLTGATWSGKEGTLCEGVEFQDKAFVNDEPAPKSIARFVDLLPSKRRGFLTFMGLRLAELHRVLKPTGSIFLHCDDHEAHNLRVLLDLIFGPANFRNAIVWKRWVMAQGAGDHFPLAKDTILFYAKSKDAYFNPPLRKRKASDEEAYPRVEEGTGRRYAVVRKGRNQDSERQRTYLDEKDDPQIPDLWTEKELLLMPGDPSRTGWPTEKPPKLMARIIEAASKEGDLVLDPFGGSGTTAAVAQSLGRDWISIELNPQGEAIHMESLRLVCGGLFADKPEVIRHDS